MNKHIQLGDKRMTIPIIQGGMGVGVSLSRLVGAVMKEGGMGVLSAAHPGYRRTDFWRDSLHANVEALKEEIAAAKAQSPKTGICAVNIMVASKDYEAYVKAAVDGHADAIICGAGMPIQLPSLVTDETILLAPIVSSSRAARLILRSWDQRNHRCADFVVVEGCEAGGHLGFKRSELESHQAQPLEILLPQVLREVAVYEQKYGKAIPVFAAGGIFSGQDIHTFMKLGASGVQMATRFIATYECDAAQAFKEKIIHARKEDIVLVKSPAGLPGRAISTRFMENVQKERVVPTHCIACMKPCVPAETPYCISEALIRAVQGDVENGLVFAGSNAFRVDKMMHVHDLIEELMQELTEEENR